MKLIKILPNKLTNTLKSLKRAFVKIGYKVKRRDLISPSSSAVPYQRVWNGSLGSEDEIMKRKLLIDGDAGKDDRKINDLIKSFVKWCTSTNETPEERRLIYQRIIIQLRSCEQSMVKSHQMLLMNRREMGNYEELYARIERGISDAQEKLSAAKVELAQAKRLQRNRQEYDALARVIEAHPSRSETADKLSKLEQEINQLQDLKKDLNEKLEKRKKQFEILLGAAQDLHQIFKEEGKNSPVESSANEDDRMNEKGDSDIQEILEIDEADEEDGAIPARSEKIMARSHGRTKSTERKDAEQSQPMEIA